MIKKIWNKITTFLSGYYSEHKDDIIIGFVIATVVGILFKATVATWFMSLWINHYLWYSSCKKESNNWS